ncbi:hypothetical protein Tco_0352114 [Tanacetum coccineum]
MPRYSTTDLRKFALEVHTSYHQSKACPNEDQDQMQLCKLLTNNMDLLFKGDDTEDESDATYSSQSPSDSLTRSDNNNIDQLSILAKDKGFGQEMHQSEEPKALYGVTSLKDYAVNIRPKRIKNIQIAFIGSLYFGNEIYSEGKKSRESSIGDSDNTGDGGKTVGKITVVTLVEEQMSPWKGNLPKLPIESNIVRLATTSIVALEDFEVVTRLKKSKQVTSHLGGQENDVWSDKVMIKLLAMGGVS